MEHRIKELDYLKSIFILLMIVFHLVYIGDKYPYIKQIVYTFHMSAFLIISGYLDNVQKDIRSFVRKLFWIFVPYMCMEAGYVIMSHILPVRENIPEVTPIILLHKIFIKPLGCLLYTSDAADEQRGVDLDGRSIDEKKKKKKIIREKKRRHKQKR